jgi:hypothetical protein
MRETWYLLENGDVVSPAKVSFDAKGRLSSNGVAVAMKGDVPHTTGVDVSDAPKVTREVVADKPKRAYKTRVV